MSVKSKSATASQAAGSNSSETLLSLSATGRTLRAERGRHLLQYGVRPEEPGIEVRRPVRPSDEEALDQRTFELAQLTQLLRGLHSLGDGLDADGSGQADHRPHDLAVHGLLSETPDEGPVDLHVVDREPLQIAERRVTRPEVVDGHPHTERLEPVQRLDGRLDVIDHDTLGNLDAEAVGR